MVIIPREKPVIENLNIYYIDVKKLLEHYQGEIGSGGVYFKCHVAEGVIFFDKDDMLNAFYKEKDLELFGSEAIDRIINDGGNYNFTVNVYKIAEPHAASGQLEQSVKWPASRTTARGDVQIQPVLMRRYHDTHRRRPLW